MQDIKTMENTFSIYWANLCILNRMESEKMEAAGSEWSREKRLSPRMVYLGDTEEIKMYEKMEQDLAGGRLGFDLLVSSRFDLFCSKKYLQGFREQIAPVGDILPIRDEVIDAGVPDPGRLFLPLVILPHLIVCNTEALEGRNAPRSMEELLDPRWAGQVYMGATDLPSAKSFLFAMWYLFGDAGLKTCVRNWRQKSAPSAARHGVLKKEFPIALLPGIFAGPGPGDRIESVWPEEGAPVLPSFAAVRKSEKTEEVVDFLKASAASEEFLLFYRDQAVAYPSLPGIEPPESLTENLNSGRKMFFPDWDWILRQDMEYFDDACHRVPEE